MQLRKRVKDVERLKEEGNTSFRSGALHDAIAKYTAAIEVSHLPTEYEITALRSGFLADWKQRGGSQGRPDTCNHHVEQSDCLSEGA